MAFFSEDFTRILNSAVEYISEQLFLDTWTIFLMLQRF